MITFWIFLGQNNLKFNQKSDGMETNVISGLDRTKKVVNILFGNTQVQFASQ